MRKLYFPALFLAILALGGGCLWGYTEYNRSREEFCRLLNGSEQVRIVSLLIRGQGKQVFIEEPGTTQYLTRAFRSAANNKFTGGVYYSLEIRLSSGRSITCGL